MTSDLIGKIVFKQTLILVVFKRRCFSNDMNGRENKEIKNTGIIDFKLPNYIPD